MSDKASEASHLQPCDIAIIGIGSLFPGARDKSEFWNLIFEGRDQIEEIPSSHWSTSDYFASDPHAKDKTYCRRGGFLPTVHVNPLDFGLLPSALTATDTGQILGLLVAKQTLGDSFESEQWNVDRERISVILGTTGATELITDMASRMESPKWLQAMRDEGVAPEQIDRIGARVSALYPEWQESTFPGLLSNVIAGRIANRLNLRGTNLVADAACASSFAALQFAINELVLKQSDLVISGGVDTLNTIFMYLCFSKTPALSPSEECRPFAANADGTLIGEGVGMIALKRLSDAEKAGDHIYAVIKGLAASSDGLGKSIYAPMAEGQERALRKTYAYAGYAPQSVELVEAHGTGTRAGDACELESLHKVFASSDSKKWCAIGSVKSQIGHTKAAAGIAGLIKATLALHNKVIPPTLKVSQPSPRLQDASSPFYINAQSRPWIRDVSHPRRASVSSFGFGGSNFHVTLEEYVGVHTKKKMRSFSSELFLFGAATKDQLVKCLEDFVQNRDVSLSLHQRAEANAAKSISDKTHRLAIVARSLADLDAKLAYALQELAGESDAFSLSSGSYYSTKVSSGKLAMLFPGQGSQYAAMSANLAMKFSAVREVWDEIAGVSLAQSDLKLHDVVFSKTHFDEQQANNDKLRLQSTEWAQPSIAASSAAMLALLRAFGLNADCYAGHSLGGLSALYAAGAIGLEDLIRITRQRGLLMSDAASHWPGGMLAIASSQELCQDYLAKSGSSATVANINAPDQTVLSGDEESLEVLTRFLKTNGIAYKRLPVHCAFHSPQLAGVRKPFFEFLQSIPLQHAQHPVLSGLNAQSYSGDASEICHTLADEICAPVQFVAMIQELYARGTRVFVEVGPRNILTQLVRRILGQQDFLALAVDEAKDSEFSLWNTLAQLAVAGVPINLEYLGSEFASEALPAVAGSYTVAVNGANIRPQSVSPAPITAEKKHEPIAVPKLNESKKERPHMDSRETKPSDSRQNAPVSVSLLDTARQIHSELARTHNDFQKTMSESHLAFMKATENCLGMIFQSGAQVPYVETSYVREVEPILQSPKQAPSLAPAQTPVQTAPMVQEIIKVEPPVEDAFKFPSLKAPVQVAAPKAPDLPVSSLISSVESEDLGSVLISVIADKTGYPKELIKLDMSLDTDLGIDSIKRVEIFSHLADKLPEAKSIDSQDMNKLGTLSEIVSFLAASSSQSVMPAKKNSSALSGFMSNV